MKLHGKRKKLDDEKVRYQFKGDINIYTVARLKNILLNELIKFHSLEFDLSGIENFDTSGFQLFLFLKREAKEKERRMQILSKSNEVIRIFDFYKTSFE